MKMRRSEALAELEVCMQYAGWHIKNDVKNDDEGATEKFKKVNNAYNTLKNGGNGRAVGGDGEYDDESDDEHDDTPYEDFANFFEEFLGRFFMSRRGGPRGFFFFSWSGGPALGRGGGTGLLRPRVRPSGAAR